MLLTIFLIKKTTKYYSNSYGDRAEWGYPNPVGYEFQVLVLIHVKNWDGLGIPELYEFGFKGG
jgi:hypothetical protein